MAHRQWYFVVKDWLNYEEISDPDERGSVLASPSAMFSNFFFPGDSLKFFCTPFSSRWEEKSKNKKKNTHTYTQMKTIKIPEYSNKTASFYG